MAPAAVAGSSTTATSSRRSSTSSVSIPFATPPTSPRYLTSRIPRPPSSSSSTGANPLGKVRSLSASAGSGSSAPYGGRRGPMSVSAHGSPAMSTSNSGIALSPDDDTDDQGAGSSRGMEEIMLGTGLGGSSANMPTAPNAFPKGAGAGQPITLGLTGTGAALVSRPALSVSPMSTPMPGSSHSDPSTPTSSTSTYGVLLQRTNSAEGSSTPSRIPTGTTKVARKQRSHSSLPRRTLMSPRGAAAPTFPPAPIAVLDSPPMTASLSPPNAEASSSLSPSQQHSSTLLPQPRRQRSGTSPLPSNSSSRAPSRSASVGRGDDASGTARSDRRASRSRGSGRPSSSPPRSSAPSQGSTVASTGVSPAKPQDAAQSTAKALDGASSSPETLSRPKSSFTVVSRSRIPRKDLSPKAIKSPQPIPIRDSSLPGVLNSRAEPSGTGPGTLATSPRDESTLGRRTPLARSPTNSPRPSRKDPGLTISPPPPPMTNRRLSAAPPPKSTLTPGTSPSKQPPVPAKSPLRGLNGAGPGSRRQSRIGGSHAVPASPIPPVPPLPDGLGLAPEAEVAPPRGRSSIAHSSSDKSIVSPPTSWPGPVSPSHNAISLNSGPPSDAGSSATDKPGSRDMDTAAQLSPDSSWTLVSKDGSEEPNAQATESPFLSAMRELAMRRKVSPAGTLTPSPEGGKARLSVSTTSTSAPVTPAASLAGQLQQLGGLSQPDSEAEEASQSSYDNFPSPYSQDSAPPSAPPSSVNLWAVGAQQAQQESPATLNTTAGGEDGHQETLTDGVMWGKRSSSLHPRSRSEPDALAAPSMPDAPGTPGPKTDKSLPATPHTPMTPRTPNRLGNHDPATRSPSMPSIRPNGNVEHGTNAPSFPRSQTGPASGLRPPQSGARPQSMLVTSPVSQSPSPTHMSRRAHLIREIANTERTYANDLALVRDAYLVIFRPESSHSQGGVSVTSGGDSSHIAPGGESRHSRRSSMYGQSLEELGKRTSGTGDKRTSGQQGEPGWRTSGHERRMSGADSAWSNAWNGFMSPVLKSPREHGQREHGHHNGSSMDSLYTTSGATSSSTSIQTPSLMASPRISSTPSSANGLARVSGASVGKPLSQADVKAVFLNIAAIAAIAETLARQFEDALGNSTDDDDAGSSGSDRLGEVFSKLLPSLRPLYTTYCARQAQASARLLELQNDQGHATYLNDCWSKVKSSTHAWNLDSMLIKPVQRITKYPLLFEDLLSCTTPAHADFIAIRQAAEGARALAMEIDNVKRRTDVISNVMGKSTSTVNLAKEQKQSGHGPRLLNLRRFKKDKSSGNDPSALPDVTPYAQSQLKDLVHRLEENDKNVRRLGAEMVDWCQTSKTLVRHEMDVAMYFLRWYSLGRRVTNDSRTEKVAALNGVLDSVLTGAWEEMYQHVTSSIIPSLGKLLEASKKPVAIVDKLNQKSYEYARYVAHRQAKKSIERMLLQEAGEYVAIHTQLLEELPVFLQGYRRIYDLALSSFASAQSKYFGFMRDKLALYSAQYISEPTELITDGAAIKEVVLDVTTARGIHKAWIERWREPNSIVRSLHITGGDGSRDASSLRGSPLSTPRNSPPVPPRPSLYAELMAPPPVPPLRTDSGTSLTSASASASASLLSPPLEITGGGNRRRSMSLQGPTTTEQGSSGPEMRPDSGSIFGSLMRRSSHRGDRRSTSRQSFRESRDSKGSERDSKSSSSGVGSGSSGIPSNRSTFMRGASKGSSKRSTVRSTLSATSAGKEAAEEPEERLSFGLPRIPTESNRSLLDTLSLTRSSETKFTSSPVQTAPSTSASVADMMSLSALGLGDGAGGAPTTAFPAQPDVGEVWHGSAVLYSCCAVADFNPYELGNQTFKGLAFLTLAAGDMIDVLHEIGRVADLTSFPYSQVGVENDGAVVARAENGIIGVAMCSFLEPLRP